MSDTCWRCDCDGCTFCLTYDETAEDDYCHCPDPGNYDGNEDTND